jgi:hypothetical protein
MDIPMLKEVIQMLRQQLDKAQADRNYVQHERVRVRPICVVTRQQIDRMCMCACVWHLWVA